MAPHFALRARLPSDAPVRRRVRLRIESVTPEEQRQAILKRRDLVPVFHP
jgi:hypothetical protein